VTSAGTQGSAPVRLMSEPTRVQISTALDHKATLSRNSSVDEAPTRAEGAPHHALFFTSPFLIFLGQCRPGATAQEDSQLAGHRGHFSNSGDFGLLLGGLSNPLFA
jgi:hypothetical protein